VASLCVGGPSLRFPTEGEAGLLIERMQELSRQIAARL
jgi:hypothetical protein